MMVLLNIFLAIIILVLINNKDVTKKEVVNYIELNKSIYRVCDDVITEHKPVWMLVNKDGLYFSEQDDFISMDFLNEFKYMYLYDYNDSKGFIECTINSFEEQLRKNTLRVTTFVPFDEYYTTYEEALEVRNNNILKRIDKEIEKMDTI